ncbi:MAG: hypothetical protein AAGC64_13750 [Bacteroidota bacterium]
MNVLRKTKALSMLSVMLLVMAHNSFPHVHYLHSNDCEIFLDDKIQDDDHHRSHGEENHHDHGNLLKFLFEHHSHSKHTHHCRIVIFQPVKSSTEEVLKKLSCNAVEFSLNFAFSEFGDHLHFVGENKSFYPLPLLCSSLRGPPVLGQ